MIFPKSIILAVAAFVAPSVNGFQIAKPAVAFHASGQVASTCLFAEEEGEAGTEAEQAGVSSSDGATDILNSPAFLKRKIDVLKSDIAQAEADIAAAREQVETGKAEWGSQLEDLEIEVRCLHFHFCWDGKRVGSPFYFAAALWDGFADTVQDHSR